MASSLFLSIKLFIPFNNDRRETRPKILWITGNKKKKDENETTDGTGECSIYHMLHIVCTDSMLCTLLASLSVDTQAEVDKDKEVQSSRTPSASYRVGRDSVEAINQRLVDRLGIDILHEATISKRTRYLNKVCKDLPPVGSGERERIREGISLEKWVSLQPVPENAAS